MRRTIARSSDTVLWICLGLATSLSSVAHAGVGVWTSGGPYGGGVYALAVDPTIPTTLYAVGGGVFKSTDSGGTWVSADTGLTSNVLVLAIDPTAPASLYAGTYGNGVFKSTDSGATWIAANTGITDKNVDSLAIDPKTPTTLYAGSYSTNETSGGVFKSTDSGGTWAITGLYINDASSLTIDPTTPAILYAATYYAHQVPFATGVFKSTDSGITWIAANTGLTDKNVFALAIDPRNPATLYAGTSHGGVFKSTDSGGSWAATNTGLTNLLILAIAVDPTVPSTLYAGTGLTGNPGGVFKSTDSGGTWVNTGLTDVSALAVAPTTPATLFASSDAGGVFKSNDSGHTWVASNVGLTNRQVWALAINPTTPATLYAGTYRDGIFHSTDSGGTWGAANTGLTNLNVGALAIDPAIPSTLYAGTVYEGGPFPDTWIFKSTDSGGTWATASTGLATQEGVSALVIDPMNPATIYAGTYGGGVFKSSDSGGTWAAVNSGLTNLYVEALAINPTTPTMLYVGIYGGGVFKSTNSGGTWAVANTGQTSQYVLALAIDPTTATTLYAGTYDAGVFKSTDSGGTWVAANAGLTNNLAVYALAINPTTPATLYAGTHYGGGVFKSTDSGGSWATFNTGLPNPMNIHALALDPTGATILYAGLDYRGVWQSTPAIGSTTALLPSSARVSGLGGTFYTTDLTVANTGITSTTFVVKFLGNNADGRGGPEKSFAIAAGAMKTFPDVLASVFGLTADYGAIRITSPSDSVLALSQTSTPGFGGTFGQSVPAARPEDLIIGGTPRTILGVREDASFRTNLVLANATEDPLDVDVTFREGTAARRFTLPPFGMTQLSRVVRALGVTDDVSGERLTLSTPSEGKSFAAYASVIDNVTNDPRTLLPVAPLVSARPLPDYWFLPSAVHASGAGGAFYTTDVTVAYTNAIAASYTLKFLGHDVDGRSGPEMSFGLGPWMTVSYTDILGSPLLSRTSDYGAIRIASQYPASDSAFIAVLAQTSTPGFGGTFGQSVPGATAADLIRTDAPRSILAIREDDSFRTNLILANATEAPLYVDVQLISAEGAVQATKRYALAPLGMTQVTRVVRDLGITTNVDGARLLISTPTTNGAFAAYASAIDNVTNDPRTLLPR